MPCFLLSRNDYHLSAHDPSSSFADRSVAAEAFRDGRVSALAGALPFDPEAAAALTAPARLIRRASPWRPPAVPAAPAIRSARQHPSPATHRERVRRAVELLADPGNELAKVVLARTLTLEPEQPISPWLLAARLRAADRSGNVFVTDLSPAGGSRNGHHLVGSTPEVLIRKRGDIVSCHPLAGSSPRSADPELDAERGRRLSASAKDLDEHRYVVTAIADALAPLCSELDIPATPSLLTTPAMWHLGTPIRGRIADPAITSFDLALAVHPTPAICGTPTPAARRHILDTEDDRGFYAGAVGWSARDGAGVEDGEWMVTIRCAELDAAGAQLTAWAGGGIVADSDPDDELRETVAKFGTILGALDLDPAALP